MTFCFSFIGFAPYFQGRRVWSLARTSLNVKVKGQGNQGKNALCTPIISPPPSSDRMVCFHCKQRYAAAHGAIPLLPGGISATCVWFMFSKTSFALVIIKFMRWCVMLFDFAVWLCQLFHVPVLRCILPAWYGTPVQGMMIAFTAFVDWRYLMLLVLVWFFYLTVSWNL